MTNIKTRAGFIFNTDVEDVQIHDWVEVPEHDPAPYAKIGKTRLDFLSQWYATDGSWSQRILSRYGVDDPEVFPDFLLHLPNAKVEYFLRRIYGVRPCSLTVHKSGSNSTNSIEVKLRVKRKSTAEGLQTLWRQLGVRTIVKPNKYSKTTPWLVQSSGIPAYLKMRPMLKSLKSRHMNDRIKKIDAAIPFNDRMKYGINDPLKDKVVAIYDEDWNEVDNVDMFRVRYRAAKEEERRLEEEQANLGIK